METMKASYDGNSEEISSTNNYLMIDNVILGVKSDYFISSSPEIIIINTKEDTHRKFFGQNIKRVVDAFKK
jgi:hypothetical protein